MRICSADEAKEIVANARGTRTIFIECTETFLSGRNTGIQRVVRNIADHAKRVGSSMDVSIVTVTMSDGKLVCVDLKGSSASGVDADVSATPRFKQKIWRALQRMICVLLPLRSVRDFVYRPREGIGLAMMVSSPIEFYTKAFANDLDHPDIISGSGDLSNSVLLLLDADWHLPLQAPIKRFKERGGKVVSVTYDLIPITHPELCDPVLVPPFLKWFDYIIRENELFVAISKSSADELKRFGQGYGVFLPPIPHFYLGSDLDLIDETPVSDGIRKIFNLPNFKFLIVGSIEPRKNHRYAIDAFEKYWADGGLGSLVVVGKYGWLNQDTINRIFGHPEFGKNYSCLGMRQILNWITLTKMQAA